MHLETLQLRDFRNYAAAALQFCPGLNVVYGANAQGKTNLLEAVHFLATGRSHRTARDHELIRHGQTDLQLNATVRRKTGALTLALQLAQGRRKSVRINGAPERKIAQLVGKLAVVFFSPDDLQLVKGAPTLRRRFLDIEIAQISATYLHYLMLYARLLSQRNALLKQERSTTAAATLEVLDEQLAAAGAQLICRRHSAVARLQPLAQQYHAMLAGGRETLSLRYDCQIIAGMQEISPTIVEAALRERLLERRKDDLLRAVTTVGPHRDDLVLTVDDQPARNFASQGQQRTAVLALKLAELAYMGAEIGEAPVLLLDDVVSELDPERRRFLLAAVETGTQAFLTCTDLADLATRDWQVETRVFRVHDGVATLESKGL